MIILSVILDYVSAFLWYILIDYADNLVTSSVNYQKQNGPPSNKFT